MHHCHMDHNYFGHIHLPSFCHICADLEEASEQDSKEDRKMPLDRTSVSEYQTLLGVMNQTQEILLFLNLTLYLTSYNREITQILTN